ncbi:TonB-dependent receptor plug domain-containing protein [uncultured Draconibacterium sp.]|uniref:TonB-dependent receptor n=1 Tax=uncultured Draconibacterium sp. TaxID=1573823 RepID=UPI0032172907
MAKRTMMVVLFFLCLTQVIAQTTQNIKLDVRKASLSQVLLDLKETYGLQFAFDNDLLSQYSVSVNRSFQSENEALLYLLRNLPLDLEKSGEVFLIIPRKPNEPKASFTQISGQVLEAKTYEPLPYSYILINRRSIQSDQQGNFNYIASADSSYNLQISHLGYFIYDTIVNRSLNRRFFLTPHIESIKEVQIISNPIEKSTLIGDRAGRMKINHQIAPILPGHGDNSVFNLLRLMPGILAAGEQSNDLLIWGAYESHSKIQFDGFTVFGLKNFNDNISVVNPFMVKNIEVMKGGYEARYGGRVGGIVDIEGKDGTLLKPTFSFVINSTTVNSMLQVPLSKKSSIMGAYRQTYYQLYSPTSINLFEKEITRGKGVFWRLWTNRLEDREVIPDFVFRDANLKYSFKGDKGSRFALSLYAGGDQFSYDAGGQAGQVFFSRTEKEKNKQLGGSMQFSQHWSDNSITHLLLSYSAFEQKSFEQDTSNSVHKFIQDINRVIDTDNAVDEVTLKAEHTLSFNAGHKLILGAGAENNHVKLLRNWNNKVAMDVNSNSSRVFVFGQDELPLGEMLDIKTGLRIVYAGDLNEMFFEPRISGSLTPSEGFKVNASWGLYNQFLSKTSVVDSSANMAYFWINADKNNISVLSAEHKVVGVSFNKDGLTVSAEAYFKTTDGLNRYFVGTKRIEEGYYSGDARAKGLDIFVKKEYKRHMAWISYTLSKTEEHFPFYLNDVYKLAPHHQKHELKFAGVFNYKSFYFSANYIYGSGFARFSFETEEGTNANQPYKRLDTSLVYKFKPGNVRAEAGISILNVFNTNNIKYANIVGTTVDDISLVGIYADAVPFTPALFFKIEL